MTRFRQGMSVVMLALGAMLAAGSRPALALNKISGWDFASGGAWISGPSGVGQDGLCDLANSTTGNNPFDANLFTTGTGNPAPAWKFSNSQVSRAELAYIYQQISIPGTGFTKLKGKFHYNGDSIVGTSVQYFRLDIFDQANGSIAKPKGVLACVGSVTLTAGATTGWVSVPFGADYSAATSGSTIYTIRVTGGAQNDATAGVQGTLQFDNVVVNVAPTGLTCAAVSASTSVSLNWAVSTAASGASGLRWYNIYRSTSPGVTTAATLVATPGVVGKTDTGTIGNTRYYYAISDQDQNLEDSPLSGEVSQLTLPGTPSAPTFSAVSDTSLTVNWSGAPGGAAGYKIERSTDNVIFNLVGTSPTTTFSDSLLTQNTTYFYRITASNATGDSAVSGSSPVSTLPSTNTPTRTNTPNATLTFLAGQTQTVLALSFTASNTPSPTPTATDTPTSTPTPCSPVVRPVCAACAYTSITAAMLAASPCDIIELQENIDEAVNLGNVAEIRGVNSSILWTNSSSLPTLQVTALFNQTCLIHDLILDHGGSAGNTVTMQGLSANVKVIFRRCGLRNSGGASGYAIVGSASSASGTDTLVFLQCQLMGKPDLNGLDLAGYTQTGSVRLQNCLLRDFSGSGAAVKLASTSNPVLTLQNCTLHNNGTALDWGCRADITNNLFTGNGTDLNPGGSASNADISTCAFGTTASLPGSGPGNLFGLSASDYVSAGTNDFHLAGGSVCIDAGTTLAAVTLDLDGTSRPRGSAYDLGAYEYIPAPTDTPTDTPSSTPTHTPTVTDTFTFSNTPSNTPTHTPTVTDTFTSSNTPSNTPTQTPTITNTFTSSHTPSNTSSPTPTFTPSFSDTFTSSNTPTQTPSNTPTFTHTFTNSSTPTQTPSDTPTFTHTPSLTPTQTPSNTATKTATPSFTPTFTFTASDTHTPDATLTIGAVATLTSVALSWTPTATPSTSENGYLSANVFRPLNGQDLGISFRSPQDDRVRIKVFNLAGELVRDLGETDVQAGVFQTLPWNGRNAEGEMSASQVYLVSLTGRHMKVLKKVILLK